MNKFYRPDQYVAPPEEEEGTSLLELRGASSGLRKKQEPDQEEPRKPPPRVGGPYEKRDSSGPLALLDKRQADSAAVTEKEAQKAELEADVMASKDLQKRKTTELLATREYIQQLHGSCDFLLQNFDLRREARANEVEALKNAKAVLHGAAYSFQQKKPAFLQRA